MTCRANTIPNFMHTLNATINSILLVEHSDLSWVVVIGVVSCISGLIGTSVGVGVPVYVPVENGLSILSKDLIKAYAWSPTMQTIQNF